MKASVTSFVVLSVFFWWIAFDGNTKKIKATGEVGDSNMINHTGNDADGRNMAGYTDDEIDVAGIFEKIAGVVGAADIPPPGPLWRVIL